MSSVIKNIQWAAADDYERGDGAGTAVDMVIREALMREGRETVIVSRHDGAVKWLAQHGITGTVISHVADPAQVAGKVVIGALPLHLAAMAHQIGSIDLPLLRAEQRGQDLTPEEMDAAGASLHWYTVEAI